MALPELFANDLAGTGIATLGAAVATTGATTITTVAVAPAALQVAGQFRIVIDSEVMIVTAGAATTTWTVTRGAEGTTAATHANSTTIYHAVTAGGLGAALTGAIIDYASATAYAAGQVAKRNGQTLQALVPIVSTWPFHQARWLLLDQKPRGVLGTGLVPISNRYGRWDTGPSGGAALSNGTDNEANSRMAHTALYDTESIFAEFTLPSPAANDVLINASIEYPSGTYRALTFGGRQATWLTTEGFVISDAMPLGIRAGEQFWVKTHCLVPATHTVTVSGAPTGGSFTLTNAGKTTAAIAWNAAAQAVRDAVVAAGLLSAEECQGAGGPLPGTAVTLTTRQLGALPAAMTHTDTLTGGAAPAVAPTVGVGKYPFTLSQQHYETGDLALTGVNIGDTTNAVASGGANPFSAMAALYQPAGRIPVVSVVGDSIMSCYLANAASSWVRRALNIPVAHATFYGETAAAFAGRGRRSRRPHAMAGNWLINTLGINDIAISASPLATMQSLYMTLWDRYANEGVRVLQATITPKSSSTDVWATVVNQTAFAQNAVRQQLNTWLRDGSPIDATTRVAVATGTVTNVYRAGEGTHPLTTTTNFPKGCIDVCQTVENDPVAQDSKWVVGYTNDGLHMLETGHQAIATAFQANLQADIV